MFVKQESWSARPTSFVTLYLYRRFSYCLPKPILKKSKSETFFFIVSTFEGGRIQESEKLLVPSARERKKKQKREDRSAPGEGSSLHNHALPEVSKGRRRDSEASRFNGVGSCEQSFFLFVSVCFLKKERKKERKTNVSIRFLVGAFGFQKVWENGMDDIEQLLSDLGVQPEETAGKENASESKHERDLIHSVFLDTDTPGGAAEPLSEVSVRGGERGSQQKRKKRNSRKSSTENASASVTQDKSGQSQKKKDKSKKKERESDSNSGTGGRRESLWAGSAFLNSPAPEDLPMPSAALLASVMSELGKKDSTAELKKMLNLGENAPDGNTIATDDLRRMLNL